MEETKIYTESQKKNNRFIASKKTKTKAKNSSTNSEVCNSGRIKEKVRFSDTLHSKTRGNSAVCSNRQKTTEELNARKTRPSNGHLQNAGAIPKNLCNEPSKISRNVNPISLSKLRRLVEKNQNEIILVILDKHSGFLLRMEQSYVRHDLLTYLFIAIGKACSADMHQTVIDLIKINCAISKSVLIHVQRYLVWLQKRRTLENSLFDSLFYIIVFLQKFQLTLPSSSSDLISILLPLLNSTKDRCLKVGHEFYTMVSEKIKEIEEQNNFFLEHHSLLETNEKSEKENLHLLEPPENFRSISVLPTSDDINFPCTFLRPNIVKGKYKNTEHYLDVQFRLLREDYIKPLRDGIAEYLSRKKCGKSLKNCNDVRVYSNVRIVREDFLNGDLLHYILFLDKCFRNINWDRSKRFLSGSLLCLSSNDFQTMLFATVVRRNVDELKKGLLCIQFEDVTDDVLNLNDSINFVVIETAAYFEAYRHNLKALQNLNDEVLPLKTCIVDVQKTVDKPQYLNRNTVFDMEPLLIPLGKKNVCYKNQTECVHPQENIKIRPVSILNKSSWPTASDLNLDESQYLALKTGLTKELAIIQGPPGTGKTYIGLRIVQLLLHNLNEWFSNEINSLPILVVCYTNHALDQFLEGLLIFTKKIVRIGGNRSNDAISKFQLRNLKRTSNRFFNSYIFKTEREKNMELRDLKKQVDHLNTCIKNSSYTVLSEIVLKKYIPSVHYESLKHEYFKEDHGQYYECTIFDWLGISSSAAKFIKDLPKENYEYHSEIFCDVSSEKTCESEDEADVEYIENERYIDYYDFDDFAVSNDPEDREVFELEDPEWKSGEQRRELIKYIKECLSSTDVMSEENAMKVEGVWMLDINKRWQLYKFWLQKCIEGMKIERFDLQQKLKRVHQELVEVRAEDDLNVLQSSHIVGMTTTGAAKYRHLVKKLNPAILIVEEAAEILESHIITSLAPKTQHIILIGDQQQLRPSTSVYMLSVKYGLNISLFERMIENGIDYSVLSTQHRMRPEIAALIVPHIYSNLKNHKDVTEFENIKGVKKNVFFLSHSFHEAGEVDSKSKRNEHEARFLIKFCSYLILQGYDPSQITVLTTYSGQLFALKALASGAVKKVRFTVVDNFQGEENDIILLSLVRSNEAGVVGFLKVPNRVCVALSRAKKGLFCIGNFTLLAEKSNLWKNIVNTLVQMQCIGPSLELICQNHPDTCKAVRTEKDFKAVPNGGCARKCDNRLQCGHACPLLCHPYSHESVQCQKPCARSCKAGHPCKKICYQHCGLCDIPVAKILKQCGHTITAPCGENECNIKCIFSCKEILRCGHQCINKCGEPCVKKCRKPCSKACDKAHPCKKKCFEVCGLCDVPVDKELIRCGHVITVGCGKAETEIKCTFQCETVLPCTHQCANKCGELCEKKCKKPCLKMCKKGHLCKKKCFEICGSCDVSVNKVLIRCGHTMTVPCGKSEDELRCSFKCTKVLPCSHKCTNLCGEPCVEGSCDVPVKKVLARCGHTMAAPCGKSEDELICSVKCTKVLHCSHKCTNLCGEPCVEGGSCDVPVNKILVRCGHTIAAPCGKSEDELRCSFKCTTILPCSHKCTNLCGEQCVEKCLQIKAVPSPLCGHILRVQCYEGDNSVELYKKCSDKLFMKCSEKCKAVLLCGHVCGGTCGSCYQGRLHVACNKICRRILMCGHRCSSKCSESCPPCQKPCENKCIHRKCPKKCCEPCIKCTEPCTWSCTHKKCTRLCSEICDRDPCNEPCPKVLPCKHPCTGFCGEPCPAGCRICDKRKNRNARIRSKQGYAKYILLQDCFHEFEFRGLNEWMMSKSDKGELVQLKTCPTCKTVIRHNFRYGNIIKTSLTQFDTIKKMVKWDKERDTKIQRNLLWYFQTSAVPLDAFFSSLLDFLSPGKIRSLQQLNTVENIFNIMKGVDSLKIYKSSTKFVFKLSVSKKLADYTRITTTWLANFIRKCHFAVSEYQVMQIALEIHRLRLICKLMQYAKHQHIEQDCPIFARCAQFLLDYKTFDDNAQKAFTDAFNDLTNKYDGNNDMSIIEELPVLKTVNMSNGHWRQCQNGHIYGIIDLKHAQKACYECINITDSTSQSNLTNLLNNRIPSSRSAVNTDRKNWRVNRPALIQQPEAGRPFFRSIPPLSTGCRGIAVEQNRLKYTLKKSNGNRGHRKKY